jgi:hypothetical protein
MKFSPVKEERREQEQRLEMRMERKKGRENEEMEGK